MWVGVKAAVLAKRRKKRGFLAARDVNSSTCDCCSGAQLLTKDSMVNANGGWCSDRIAGEILRMEVEGGDGAADVGISSSPALGSGVLLTIVAPPRRLGPLSSF